VTITDVIHQQLPMWLSPSKPSKNTGRLPRPKVLSNLLYCRLLSKNNMGLLKRAQL